MAMLGQASGGFTESSSSLRILHLGIRNTVGQLAEDCYTQTNPPVITSATSVTSQLTDTTLSGVLSGSVAFTRGDNQVGGPDNGESACVPLGIFINSANGNSFENTPGASLASNKGPYVSGQGTYANALIETQAVGVMGFANLSYAAGDILFASLNGYLTNGSADNGHEEGAGVAAGNTTLGILKMPADATQDEIVYDQRI